MKLKFTLKGVVVLSVLALATVVGLWNCNTEEIDEYDFPFITATPSEIQFTPAGGDSTLVINTNRKWTITGQPVWCSPSKTSGEGPATITITCTHNPTLIRKATLSIATSTLSADVLIEQRGEIVQELIWFENCGTTASNQSGNWPYVEDYDGWLKEGLGAASVTYASAGGAVSVRSNSTSSGYTDASGGSNVMMAAAGASFLVENIKLSAETTYTLSFGTNETSNVLTVFYSTDGTSWVNIDFTKTSANWGLVDSLSFTVPAGSSILHLKFTATNTTYGTRLDDMKLMSGGILGPMLSLSPNTWNPSGNAASTTVNITSNTSWTITPDANATWCTVGGALSGTDDGTFTINVTANTGAPRAATITVKSTDNTITKSLIVTQSNTQGDMIWYENCGTSASSGTAGWPQVADYTGWLRDGIGAANVEYAAEGGAVSVRTNSVSGSYTGASGGSNVMMAAAGASFLVKNITLNGQTAYTLSFGANETNSVLSLFYSTDGTTWINLPFSKTTNVWGLVENVVITVPSGSSILHLKFTAGTTTYGTRVDDMKLVSGGTPSSYLSVSPSNLTFDSAGESKSFTVSANVNWTVSSSATWCANSPASGSNNGAVTVTASPNTAATSRSATITVSSSTSGVSSQYIAVAQSGAVTEVPTDLNTPVVWNLTTFSSTETVTSLQSSEGSTSQLTVMANSGSFTTNPNTGGYVVTDHWAVNDAWIMTIPITSFTGGDVKVSFNTQSSNTGPRNWEVEWSANGSSWASATSGAYALVNGASATSYSIEKTMTVSGVTNKLYIRTRVTDNQAANANNTTTIGTGGTNRFIGTITVEKAAATTPTLSVNPSALSFVAAGEQHNFTITSSATTWTAASSESWCTLSTSTGTGNSAVTVTASPNTATTSRSATITVSGTGGVSSQYIAVTQAAGSTAEVPTDLNTPVVWDLTTFSGTATITSLQSSEGSTSQLTVDANSGLFTTNPNTGGYVVTDHWAVNDAWIMTIPITSFTGGDVKVSFNTQSSNTGPRNWEVEWSANGSSWASATSGAYALVNGASATSYSIEKIMTVSGVTNKLYIRTRVTDNQASNSNNTTTIGTGGTNRFTGTITVEKAASVTPTLSVNPSTLSFVAAGEQHNFSITSSATTWTANSSETWCTLSTGTGTGNSAVTVTASPNTATTSRSATITVSGTGGVSSQYIAVTQAGAAVTPTLSVSPSSLTFVAAGEQHDFSITSSATTWTVNSSETWCTLGTSTGTGNSAVTVTASANTATTSRSATITVSGTGGVSSQYIEVTQNGVSAPTVLVEWNFSSYGTTPATITSCTTTTTGAGTITLEMAGSPTIGSISAATAASAANNYLNALNWPSSATPANIGKGAWMMEIPATTSDNGNIQIAFTSQSSNTGPRDFTVEWSVDNSTWSPATSGDVTYQNTSSSSGKTAIMAVSGITNRLYLRIRATTEYSVRAGTGTYPPTESLQPGGTCRLTSKVTVTKL